MSTEPSQGEQPAPLLGVTATDAGLERQLRASLRTIRDRTQDPALAGMLDDVLAGRRSLRDVARTPEWNAAVESSTRQATQAWARMSPQERAELVQTGREELEQARLQAYRENQG